MAGWWSRCWKRLFGRRARAGRGVPAPATLVARVESAPDHDRAIVKLAEESLRRGFPDQAEIAYEKAALHYVQAGHHRKAVAVLRALSRLRPDDPVIHEQLGGALEALERRADAARSYRAAAERHRFYASEERAQELVARARQLELRELSESSVSSPELEISADRVPPAETDAEPAGSLDLPADEVNSLVMEALSVEVASGEVPSMPGASALDGEPLELPGLYETEPETDRDDAAAPTAVRPAVSDVGPSAEPALAEAPDPFEEETPVEGPDTLRERRPSIPDASTLYEPGGSAAMRSELGSEGAESPEPTRVAPDPEVARLLEALRREK